MRCSVCGKLNPSGLRYCQDCGTQLASSHPPRDHVVSSLSGGPIGSPPAVRESSLGPYATESVPSTTSSRLRPEVPNFDLSLRPKSDRVRCARCASVVGGTNSYCPQCGASLAAPSSPLADAAHYSVPPRPMRHQFGTALAEVGAELAVHAAVGTPMCPVCTTALPSGAQTCLRCGHPLSGSTPDSMAALSYVPVQPRTTSTIRPMSASTDIARSDLQPEPQSNGDRPGLAMLAPDGSVARMVCLDSDRVDIGRTAGEISYG